MNNNSPTTDDPLLQAFSQNDPGSQIEEERTSSQNSSLYENSGVMFRPPSLRRTSSAYKKDKDEKKSPGLGLGFMSKITDMTSAIGNTASKKFTSLFNDEADDVEQVAEVELSED